VQRSAGGEISLRKMSTDRENPPWGHTNERWCGEPTAGTQMSAGSGIRLRKVKTSAGREIYLL
jgi:hypothetical protein